MVGVTKATYSAWEKATIAAFYTAEQKRTPLVPADGKPAVLSKEKVILVVDAVSTEDDSAFASPFSLFEFAALFHTLVEHRPKLCGCQSLPTSLWPGVELASALLAADVRPRCHGHRQPRAAFPF